MTWKRRTAPLTTSPNAEDVKQAARRLGDAAAKVLATAPEHPVFQEQCGLRLVRMAQQAEELGMGSLVFESTETWRSVYEAVLSTCRQRRYLSSALIFTDDYWQDRPGRVSLEFNFRLIQHGFHVARVLVIDDYFWPEKSRLPDKQLLMWAQEQQSNGVAISMARVSEVETDLRLDFGVYGEVAAGYQVVDEQGHTERFSLKFDKPSRQQAEELWRQLELFSRPLEELLAEST